MSPRVIRCPSSVPEAGATARMPVIVGDQQVAARVDGHVAVDDIRSGRWTAEGSRPT